MAKIFFFACDPGGANVIAPVYKGFHKKEELLIYAKNSAYKILLADGIPVKDINEVCDTRKECIYDFLKTIKPNYIVTGTSLNDYTERFLWESAGKLGIKSIAILDQWMNLGIRFSEYNYTHIEEYQHNPVHAYLPHRICVMDNMARETLIEAGIEEDRIIVTGQPHFDVVREKYKLANEAYDREYFNIVFASEPILEDYDKNCSEDMFWGYNQLTIFGAILQELQKVVEVCNRKMRVIVRPHPRENNTIWLQKISQYKYDNIMVICDTVQDSFAVMKSADLVCGMSSMFLLESAICNKSILSVEIGLKRKNPFVLDEIGCCKSILSQEILHQRLVEAICGEVPSMEFDFIKDASKNVIFYIEEELQDE